ncbi:response regulator [Niabella beijingensis]|uniref:response regulator n=1 Tax=Niabella beijingensis TaxID=2872700 RepID=UPI001CBAD2EE|nr:response regulator transcription factor [Niabella beijingensis]MBZ4189398.1 response regulator transcription factor [Niabella beijingensis]
MESIKIIVCDDHPLINEGLQKMINNISNMVIVEAVATISQLFEKLRQKQPDIILLDINLPDGDGTDVCLTIRKQFPRVKILIISSRDDRSTLIKMIRNGASGYLLKSASVEEIENAINLVYLGGTYYSEEMQQTIASILSDTLQKEQPLVTRREKELLFFLKSGLSSQQIAEKLFISTRTVETHRKNLLAKFNVSNTISMLDKARTMGLI